MFTDTQEAIFFETAAEVLYACFADEQKKACDLCQYMTNEKLPDFLTENEAEVIQSLAMEGDIREISAYFYAMLFDFYEEGEIQAIRERIAVLR